jgi:hypothetical protein
MWVEAGILLTYLRKENEQINGQLLYIIEDQIRFDHFATEEWVYFIPFNSKADILFSIELHCSPEDVYRFYTREEEPQSYSLHWLPGSPPFFDAVLGLVSTADGQRYMKNFNYPPPQDVQWSAWTISEHSQKKRFLGYADSTHSRWIAIPEFQDTEILRWSVKLIPEIAEQLENYIPVEIEVVDD